MKVTVSPSYLYEIILKLQLPCAFILLLIFTNTINSFRSVDTMQIPLNI